MKLTNLVHAGCLLAAFAVAPAIAHAAGHVYTQAGEAVQVLGDLRGIAHETLYSADRLCSLPTIMASGESHSRALQTLSDDINELGRKLATLQVLQSSVPEDRRAEIARANTIARNLAAETTRAIQFVQQNPATLWQIEYRQYTTNISKQSQQLAQLLDRSEEYARLSARERELQRSLALE